MKTIAKIAFLFFAVCIARGDIPKAYRGRWYCDEVATAKEWIVRARSEQELRLAKAMPKMQAEMKKKFGKQILGFIDISASELVAGDSIMNARFEVLSVVASEQSLRLEARYFETPNDDNPHVEKPILSKRDDVVIIELRDEEGRLAILDVLTSKKPNQASELTAANDRGSR